MESTMAHLRIVLGMYVDRGADRHDENEWLSSGRVCPIRVLCYRKILPAMRGGQAFFSLASLVLCINRKSFVVVRGT